MESIMSSQLLSTRRGTILVGVGAGLLAAIVLLVYLSQYRESLRSSATPVTVLQAKRLIEKNTAGEVIASQELFVPTTLPQSQLREGAVSDAAVLRGQVAVRDIYPGQQLTQADFVPATSLLVNQLAKNERAIAMPADSIRGLVGHIQAGDRVDVYVGFNNHRGVPIISLLAKDTLVLSAPGGATGGVVGGGKPSFVIKADDQLAPELAFAADYGRIWLVMRPAGPSAAPTRDALVTAESLLVNVRPVVIADRTRVRSR